MENIVPFCAVWDLQFTLHDSSMLYVYYIYVSLLPITCAKLHN